MSPALNTLSLFSGTGGLDSGLIQSGSYNLLISNDIKKFMVKGYSLNFEGEVVDQISDKYPLIIQNDVANLDFDGIEKNIDVVVGGPPCQDFSILRASTKDRQGIDVKRGQLYSHFIRALVSLKPKAFIFENVPGLTKVQNGNNYKTIISDFENLHIRWNELKKELPDTKNTKADHSYHLIHNEIVDSSKLGVPQNRKRLIIVGVRKDLIKKAPELESIRDQYSEHLKFGYSQIEKYPLTSMEALTGKPFTDCQEIHDTILEQCYKIKKQVHSERSEYWNDRFLSKMTGDVEKDYFFYNKNRSKEEIDVDAVSREHKEVLKELNYHNIAVDKTHYTDDSNELLIEPKEREEKIRLIPPNENYSFLVGTDWEIRKNGVSQIYRRLHHLRPSYTVVAYGGGGMSMYHYDTNRTAITNRERARLQSFPDDFQFMGKYTVIKSRIGEAVPPLLGKRVGHALAEVLKELD